MANYKSRHKENCLLLFEGDATVVGFSGPNKSLAARPVRPPDHQSRAEPLSAAHAIDTPSEPPARRQESGTSVSTPAQAERALTHNRGSSISRSRRVGPMPLSGPSGTGKADLLGPTSQGSAAASNVYGIWQSRAGLSTPPAPWERRAVLAPLPVHLRSGTQSVHTSAGAGYPAEPQSPSTPSRSGPRTAQPSMASELQHSEHSDVGGALGMPASATAHPGAGAALTTGQWTVSRRFEDSPGGLKHRAHVFLRRGLAKSAAKLQVLSQDTGVRLRKGWVKAKHVGRAAGEKLRIVAPDGGQNWYMEVTDKHLLLRSIQQIGSNPSALDK